MKVSPFVLAAVVAAATATAQEPAFEVASIKPSRAEHPMMQMQVLPGGRFVVQNASLRTLLSMAFDLPGFEIVGTPEWGSKERYDIEARAPAAWAAISAAGAPSELWPMVRSLLRDRFGLVARREPREFDGFALLLDSRGSVGPRLKATDVDCKELPPDARRPGADGRPRCGMVSGAFGVRAGSTPVSELARHLSQRFGRPVRDDTRLTGSFDFELEFAPEQATQGAFESTAPSLNVALQEQLGLRLEPRRVTRSVVVVESVHRPTEN